MRRVLIVGDANVDIIVPYPKFLNAERTSVEYPSPCLQGGGTSANTAVALSRLGVPVSFMGTIGNDQYGKYIMEDFIKENVDITPLIVEEALYTVGVFAFIDETGERYLWGWPREKQAFKELLEDKVSFEAVRQAEWVHSSGMALVHDSSARHTIIKIFKEAYTAGVTTSFDLNLRVDDGILNEEYAAAVKEILKYCNYVLGSGEEEFYYLHPEKDWADSARSFVTKERTIIARMGKDGSMALSQTEEVTEKAFPVQVVDTVGAGDVYNAGFIAARLSGRNLRESLRYGNGVSGYTVGRKGARNCPNKEEADQFMRGFDNNV